MSDTPQVLGDEVVELLKGHRAVGGAPRVELEWLAAHGTLGRYPTGHMIARKGEPVDALYLVLEGRVSHLTDQGGGWRRVIDYRAGDVAGQLPYSRLTNAPGNSVIQEPSVLLRVPREHLTEIPIACPHVAAELVHVMVDRARAFKASDLQVEKLASLGKLAAGLAHELNNPASAAIRSAQLLSQALDESDEASRSLGAAQLHADESAVIERVRAACLAEPTTVPLSSLEQADREEAITKWLDDHDADESLGVPLAESALSPDMLSELASTLSGDKLNAALRCLATACAVRGLARDIERASSRVHALVSAVKGFTYMDHASVAEPVDVAKGLSDTLVVMAAKARAKSASLRADVATDLPRVRGSGGELNQVWANLVDNALDAVADGGKVTVTARAEGESVVVRVLDDGSGIPADVKGKIWDPFFTTKAVGKGTGLGLDIVRRLVDRNDGLIDVESEPGRTEFRVALPVVR
jgi:signal transduction histidine kinase